MSGKWISAANRAHVYPRRTRGERGDGTVSDVLTNAVLRELARIAHDAGIAQVGDRRLADNLKTSERSVRYALKRLEADGHAVRVVRGTGNRHNRTPRESVYILRRLPDAEGVLHPDAAWLAGQWPRYVATRRWRGFDRHSQTAIRAVWSGQPNPLLPASQTPTSGKPLPHTSQGDLQEERKARVHPRVAERRRSQLRLVPDAPALMLTADPTRTHRKRRTLGRTRPRPHQPIPGQLTLWDALGPGGEINPVSDWRAGWEERFAATLAAMQAQEGTPA